MKRLLTTLLVYLFINSYNLNSQTIYSVDKWMEYIEEMASETEDEAQIENLYSDLSYLSEHPFELNSVTETELKRLPFLSDQQINSLLAYRVKYGKLVTLYELKNVEGMDFSTISLLLPFVYIGDISVNKRPFSVKNMLKYGSNELQIRYDKCFQQKRDIVHIRIVSCSNIRTGNIWGNLSIIPCVIRILLMTGFNGEW